MLDCFSLHKLHTTYCMSLYGCEHGRPQEFFQGGGANLWGGPPKNL